MRRRMGDNALQNKPPCRMTGSKKGVRFNVTPPYRGLGSNGTKNQRKKNIRTFHRIALKSSGTETYASKRHHSEWMYCPIGLRLDFVAVEALLLQLLPVQQMNIFLTY